MAELVEGARLLSECTLKRCTEGSNPSLSAISVKSYKTARFHSVAISCSYSMLVSTVNGCTVHFFIQQADNELYTICFACNNKLKCLVTAPLQMILAILIAHSIRHYAIAGDV